MLFLSYSALKAADECSYQEDRAVSLLLNYAIRLEVMGVSLQMLLK
ncbi:hypothetical protein [Campylobacter upsaliensis]|nr:hypothetical protein [Campylobacter upsaliensis]